MAKNKNTTNNDDLMEDEDVVAAVPEDVVDDLPTKEEAGIDEDSGFYTMGDIKVDEDSEENDKEEFKKASKVITAVEEDSEAEEWVNDDNVNLSDTDEFLDKENFDSDNYGYEDSDD